MSHRYYSANAISGSAGVQLQGAEAHHLLHVLRAAPGMRVTLFDGSGSEFVGEIVTIGRSTVDLSVVDRRDVDRELPFALTLGVPLPKGERQRWLVEKAVEMGVSRLAPLDTERSVATGEKASRKLSRYVIEACKQCGRNRLMEIAEPLDWAHWLALPAAANSRRWIADLSGRPLNSDDLPIAAPTLAAVGPEGGLTEGELAAARDAGWTIVSLGPRILRIETAALALAAIVSSQRHDGQDLQ